jgi:hypothetical protein
VEKLVENRVPADYRADTAYDSGSKSGACSIIDLLVVENLDWDNTAVLIRIPTLPKLSISLASSIPST